LAVPSGDASRVIVRGTEKHKLPTWLRRFGWRLKEKNTVRSTRGTDGALLVVLVRPDDHRFMIATFLATKAWVLKRGFALG
jgi:hypothetical protein